MKQILLVVHVLPLVIALGYSDLRAIQHIDDRGTPVQIFPLGPKRSGPRSSFANGSGIRESLRVVIRDKQGWTDLWNQIHGLYSPPPPLPNIDFSHDMLIVAALGERPTGGYQIIIDSVYEKESRLEIVIRSVSPGKSCIVTSAVTSPVDIVRIAKTDRSVAFKETEIVHECDGAKR